MRKEVIFCDRVISNGTSSSASLASSIASSLSLRNSYVTRQLTRVSILTRLLVRISIAASCASFSEQRRTSLACYCAFAVDIHTRGFISRFILLLNSTFSSSTFFNPFFYVESSLLVCNVSGSDSNWRWHHLSK